MEKVEVGKKYIHFKEDDDVSTRKDNITGQKHRFELMIEE